MVRISEDHLSYAIYLDWCSYKEIYHIQFNKIPQRNKKIYKSGYKVDSCLIGKYDVICPNLFESKFSNEKCSHEIVNQQMRIIPNYKYTSENKLFRDGFSLLLDQIRLDFDLDFISYIPSQERIKYHFSSRSSIFDYEHQVCSKIKKNLNPECVKDDEFFKILIVKVKIREEIIKAKAFSENQKFKLLRYFSKTVQAHSEVEYTKLVQRVDSSDAVRSANIQRLMVPRSELFGANIITFMCMDS